MKLETHAHHLFDALRKKKVHAGLTPAAHDYWISLMGIERPIMERAPLFVLRDPVNTVMQTPAFQQVTRQKLAICTRLPSRTMLIEVRADGLGGDGLPEPDDIWIVYARQEEGFIQTLLCATALGLINTWSVYPFVMRVGGPEQTLETYFLHPDDGLRPPDKGEAVEIMWRNSKTAALLLVGLLCLMNSPATEVQSETITVPRKVNRGRSLLNKSRVPDHTILTLPKVVHVSPDDHGPHGTHASPKTHWRRAHKRHYASGKVVDIPEILVNPGEGDPPPYPVTEVRVRHPELLS